MRAVAFLLAGLLCAVAGPAAQTVRPKLVVMISIDQMRADYIDRYQHQWSKGLKRLVTEGAWFRQADSVLPLTPTPWFPRHEIHHRILLHRRPRL